MKLGKSTQYRERQPIDAASLEPEESDILQRKYMIRCEKIFPSL